eukprot:TRINITY_DN24823_c0_g1_i1.p1 TRINITY_DN24823_c0_g1~~TRINITY_DN24823_c0_g1_i1.p1  ORF type:complete len:1009 (+),score=217.67 TRINITY_DN24823_c0_g1_i1:85-3111(+)
MSSPRGPKVRKRAEWNGDPLPDSWEGPLSAAARKELARRAARLPHVDLARRARPASDCGGPYTRLRVVGAARRLGAHSCAAVTKHLRRPLMKKALGGDEAQLAGCCFAPDDAGDLYLTFRDTVTAERVRRTLADLRLRVTYDAGPGRRLGGAVPSSLAAAQVGMQVRMRRGQLVPAPFEGSDALYDVEPDCPELVGTVLAAGPDGIRLAWERAGAPGQPTVPDGETTEAPGWWDGPDSRVRGAGVGHALGSALQAPGCRLIELRAGGCGLGPVCACALADGISANTTLRLLDLSNSPDLGDVGVATIAAAAPGSALEELVLARCSLTDDSAGVLAPLLCLVGPGGRRREWQLRRLSVAGNPALTDAAAERFVRSVSLRRSAVSLAVSGCGVSPSSERRVAAACCGAALRRRRCSTLFNAWRARLALARARRKVHAGWSAPQLALMSPRRAQPGKTDARLIAYWLRDRRAAATMPHFAAALRTCAAAGLWRPPNLLFPRDIASAAALAAVAAAAWSARYGYGTSEEALLGERAASPGSDNGLSESESSSASSEPAARRLRGTWRGGSNGEKVLHVVQQDASGALICVSMQTGEIRWEVAAPPYGGGPPVVATLQNGAPGTVRCSTGCGVLEVHGATTVAVLARVGGAHKGGRGDEATRRRIETAVVGRISQRGSVLDDSQNWAPGDLEAAVAALFDRFDTARSGILTPRGRRRAAGAFRAALPDAVARAASAALAKRLWSEVGSALDGSGVAPDGSLGAAVREWVQRAEDLVVELRRRAEQAAQSEDHGDLRSLAASGAVMSREDFVQRGVACVDALASPAVAAVLAGEQSTAAAAEAAAPAEFCDDWEAEYTYGVGDARSGRVRIRAERGGGLVATKLGEGGPKAAPTGSVLWRCSGVPRVGLACQGVLVAPPGAPIAGDVGISVALREDGAVTVSVAALLQSYHRAEVTTPRGPPAAVTSAGIFSPSIRMASPLGALPRGALPRMQFLSPVSIPRLALGSGRSVTPR